MKNLRKTMLLFMMAFAMFFVVKADVNAAETLQAPTGLYQEAVGETGVRVKFAGAYGYQNYDVQVSLDNVNWVDVQPQFAQVADGATATVEKLETGKAYSLRMRAHMINTEDVSAWTQPIKVVTSPGKVSSAIKQTGIKDKSLTVSWGAAQGATGYELYYADGMLDEHIAAGETDKTSYTVSGLKKDKDYIVVVFAYTIVNEGTPNQFKTYDSSYYTNASTYLEFNMELITNGNATVAMTLPEAVKGLKSLEWGPNSKNLYVGWTASEAADGYEIVFTNAKGKKAQTANISREEFTNKGYYLCSKLGKNTYGKAKIRAYVNVNGKKQYGAYSKQICFISQPQLNKRGYFRNGYLEFSWKKVNGATGYDVYIATSNKASAYKKVKSVGKNTTKYSTSSFGGSKISKGKTYYIYVVAKKKVGGKTYKSVTSEVLFF